MKLLVQADDYGMTRAVAQGIIYGIRGGIIRNTGLFVNMPWSEECVEWIKPLFGQIAFGIDFNLSTGKPLCTPSSIPTLVRPDGFFYASWESRRMDAETGGDGHAREGDIVRELQAQLERFREIVGREPDYIHPHAYTSPLILAAERKIANENDIPFTSDVWMKIAGTDVPGYRMSWYKKPATLENQRDSSLKNYILEHSSELLSQEYGLIAGHMGYVDQELLDLSSYTLYRVNDLAAAVSPEILEWIKENQVELVNYRDLCSKGGLQ